MDINGAQPQSSKSHCTDTELEWSVFKQAGLLQHTKGKRIFFFVCVFKLLPCSQEYIIFHLHSRCDMNSHVPPVLLSKDKHHIAFLFNLVKMDSNS